MAAAPSAAAAAKVADPNAVDPNAADPADLDFLDGLVKRALSAGADAADAILIRGEAVSLAQRMREPETLERSEGQDLGLRVLIGKRQAIVSTTDLRQPAVDELVARVVAMAREVPEDEFIGLADPEQLLVVDARPRIDMWDTAAPSDDDLIARAKACEEAALAVDGVRNSEGAEAGWSRSRIALAASNGFTGGYAVSRHSLGVRVVAGEGTGMERDSEGMTRVHLSDIDDPETIGTKAGERTVRRLGPRKVKTQQVPVVFDPRVSASMVGHLASAINGAAIARGTSFLKDRMGEAVLADGIDIIDDPHRPRGLASKPFDAEGIANARRAVIENGVLTTWILDLRTARKLGLKSTGHAARGTGGPPSPSTTNLYMGPGSTPPEDLIGEIKQGFYVTDMMGFGVNMVTGDYSRGASGFWIENGQLTFPVSEMTIAGNLKTMFRALTPANDLEFRYGTNAPTLRIDGMTVAGN